MEPFKLSEIFAGPSGTTTVAATFFGVKLYTSDKLKRNFIIALSKTGRAAPAWRGIQKLVKDGTITPVFLTKGIIKFLLKRKPPGLEGDMGWTVGDKIYIFVDNHANIFGFASNDELAIVTLHELVHLFAIKYPKKFLGTFKNELIDFYKEYYAVYFSADPRKINDNDIFRLLVFMLFKLKMTNALLMEYHQLLKDTIGPHTTLTPELFERNLTNFIILCKLVLTYEAQGLFTGVAKAVRALANVTKPFRTAYEKVFGIRWSSQIPLFYQEIYNPHEVIAIVTFLKKPNAKIFRIINSL